MLTHIDENNLPTMVDVTEKKHSVRTARAQSTVILPSGLRDYFKGDELILKKGPVFQTAIIAGTQAVKRTYEWIPLCHSIPIESCKFRISTEATVDGKLQVKINCEVKTTYKTGVEMEALVGVTASALTVYDMCKAISHDILIHETKLLSKTGGKRAILEKPIYGLVLTGGRSERMGEPKALLEYRGEPYALRIFELIKPYCQEVYLSARKDQWKGSRLESLPVIEDSVEGNGPIIGMLSAFKKFPEANWLVIACDLPLLNQTAIEALLENYDSASVATVFKNRDEGFPEALCGLYTPQAHAVFAEALRNDIRCPVKVLRNSEIHAIDPSSEVDLTNVNTFEEFQAFKGQQVSR